MSLLNRISLLLGIILAIHSLPTFAVESGKVDTPIMFSCNVSFSAKGTSAYIVLGYTNIKGSGAINCYDYVKKVVQRIPIDVVVKGPGLGLGVTGVNISGIGAGIGLNESPEALLGTYVAVRGNAAVGLGGAVGANLRVAKGSFNIGLSLEGGSGLGAGVDLLTVELKRSRKKLAVIHKEHEHNKDHHHDKEKLPLKEEKIEVSDLHLEKNEINNTNNTNTNNTNKITSPINYGNNQTSKVINYKSNNVINQNVNNEVTVKVGQKIRIVNEKGQTVRILRVRRR